MHVGFTLRANNAWVSRHNTHTHNTYIEISPCVFCCIPYLRYLKFKGTIELRRCYIRSHTFPSAPPALDDRAAPRRAKTRRPFFVHLSVGTMNLSYDNDCKQVESVLTKHRAIEYNSRFFNTQAVVT